MENSGMASTSFSTIQRIISMLGKFKGMAKILEERGYQDAGEKKAQCRKKFTDCPEGPTTCCCCRILYNEPDFKDVDSILEAGAKACKFQILFLLKFHCELNFIKQCWGHAKQRYRIFPPSSKEGDLERNVLQTLDEVPVILMHWYVDINHWHDHDL
jgi:hypothetical protein